MLKKTVAFYLSAGIFWGGLGLGFSSGKTSLGNVIPVSIGITPLAQPNQLSFLLNQKFREPLERVYKTPLSDLMPNAMGRDAKPATEAQKKSKTIWWILGGIAVVVGGYFIYKAVTKKTPTHPPVTPTYKETTRTGTIKDVKSNATLAGVVLEYDDINKDGATIHETYTTDGSGVYKIMFKEGTTPKLTISLANYVTRTTYPKWGPDYSLVNPSSVDTTTVNNIMRIKASTTWPDFAICRWVTQPEYIIVTQDMDDITKGYIKDVLKTNEIEQLTGGKIKGTTTPTEVATRIDFPAKNTVVYEFRDDFTTDSVASTFANYDVNTYEITGVIVKLNINKRANVRRQTILHESGHGVGHWSHGTLHQMLMGDSAHYVGYVTQWDIDNGTIAYNRPCGNTFPDNDPETGGANDTLQSAANMMKAIPAIFSTHSQNAL